jgi:hypothetical protein
MGFFSRKPTTSKHTNNSESVGGSNSVDASSYAPPTAEGNGDSGVTITNSGSFELAAPQQQQQQQQQLPQPVGYKIDPAGDGSDYVNADHLVAPQTKDASATATAAGSVDGNDTDVQDATAITNVEANSTNIDIDEEAGLAQPSHPKGEFNGIRGVVQAPKYKDLKYFILFVLHFGITIWWFVDSCIPVSCVVAVVVVVVAVVETVFHNM